MLPTNTLLVKYNTNSYYCYWYHMSVYVYKQTIYILIQFLGIEIKCFARILICEK